MSVAKANFMKVCVRKWRRTGRRGTIAGNSEICDKCCKWCVWPYMHEEEEESIVVSSDVPKGHLAVYVGECNKRFVINISLLKNPLFQALLDRAREAYDFNPGGSRLHIPCDESLFLDVVRCAKSPHDRKFGIFL